MAENTDYVVLKNRKAGHLDPDQEVWVPVTDKPVNASTNKEAIVKATEGASAEEKTGDFAAPSVRNFPVIPREVKTVEVDEFGESSTTGSRRMSDAEHRQRKEEAGGERGD